MHFLRNYACPLCRKFLVRSRYFFMKPQRARTDLSRHYRWSGMANFTSAADALQTQATIYALSSGHGTCGVAVIRLSGPASCDVVVRMAKFSSPPKPRYAALRRIVNPATEDLIDRGLVLWFPGPKSFTGEDSAEFHVHGGPSVVAAMLAALGAIPGLRHAQPGEFTRRAFENGKLDLTEVEGLADLIHAQTEAQRRQALRQMDGHLSALYNGWRTRLLKSLANIEAYIDFGEDEGIEDDIMQQVHAEVKAMAAEIEDHLQDNRRGERLRSGVRVAILGRPNVGKSSLLNQMCQRPAAIVSSVAGTTRDVVESTVDIGGYPVLFSDTAGLRETEDEVEREGVRRALQRAEEADVQVVVFNAQEQLSQDIVTERIQDILASELKELGLSSHLTASSLPLQQQQQQQSPSASSAAHRDPESECGDAEPITSQTLVPADLALQTSRLSGQQASDHSQALHAHLGRVQRSEDGSVTESKVVERDETQGGDGVETIVVFNKLDLLGEAWQGPLTGSLGSLHWSCVSCTSGQGIPEFSSLLASRVQTICGNPCEGSPSLTAARHRTLLTQCLASLERFWAAEGDCVLAAEHLRRAGGSLGKITGRISTEDILDVIFRDFCIGK